MIFKQAFKFIIHKKVFSKSSRKIIRSKKKRNETFIHIGHNFQKPYRTYNLAWFPKTEIIQFEF